MKKYLVLILFVCSLQTAYTQPHSIGYQLGLGKSYLTSDEYSDKHFISFINDDNYTDLSLSFLCGYKLKNPIYNLVSGIKFNGFTMQNNTLYFVKIPVGMDFVFGSKNNYFCGFGLIGQDFLSKTKKYYNDYKRCQIGYYLNMGFKFNINENNKIIIKTTFETSTALKEINISGSPGNSSMVVSYYLKELIANCGFTHQIKCKKKK